MAIDALCEVASGPEPSLSKLLTRKAELIIERAGNWEHSGTAPAGSGR